MTSLLYINSMSLWGKFFVTIDMYMHVGTSIGWLITNNGYVNNRIATHQK
ncbi:hypothetical protein BH222_001962 [Salmonella enterica subsp. enterica serovar Saintpaul]|uniref:Uncharacterized protein n=5 Tax=Salmonella enterica TaxID=28901 RepID=A0A749B219_SALER|nr:hypothetical protein [Salmonella enterica subsp. enterica serovar Saintpaul]EDN5103451.1 hypothetical protein [Salmonella enterica subsp. enterica serovar Holcomb]EDN6509941.1 hypothetical protein [Salmonella enterica]EDP8617389.1 hypothetical protein [Salmonella enterica subsp. enterica]EDP8912427.1 hypothetical protein [Salmonella enterica subsp. enterica serovar Chailey]EDP9481135.1 hypothetical protein [Salmonella enterica subsp. enterica serovar Havana]EDQ0088887.1 hypothetical protei